MDPERRAIGGLRKRVVGVVLVLAAFVARLLYDG
jgi:hypothetical protein